MSHPAAVPAPHDAHAEHEHGGFISTYIFSQDHKMIGKQFLFMALFMMIFGGLFALLVRWQLAFPEQPVPGFSWVPEPYMYEGIIPPEFYNSLFTMHATLMVFFVVMPLLVGCFGNFLIPLMIGTRDMAFPVINMLSFWIALGGRRHHAVELLRPGRRGRRGLDVVRAAVGEGGLHRRRTRDRTSGSSR